MFQKHRFQEFGLISKLLSRLNMFKYKRCLLIDWKAGNTPSDQCETLFRAFVTSTTIPKFDGNWLPRRCGAGIRSVASKKPLHSLARFYFSTAQISHLMFVPVRSHAPNMFETSSHGWCRFKKWKYPPSFAYPTPRGSYVENLKILSSQRLTSTLHSWSHLSGFGPHQNHYCILCWGLDCEVSQTCPAYSFVQGMPRLCVWSQIHTIAACRSWRLTA